MKELVWLADTREVLASFPDKVRKEIGFALWCEETQVPNADIKPLKGFKHTVREVRSRYEKNAYRAAYVVNLGEHIYVLHVFQKKSTTGIATPKPDLRIIEKRLKELEQELRRTKQ